MVTTSSHININLCIINVSFSLGFQTTCLNTRFFIFETVEEYRNIHSLISFPLLEIIQA